MQLKYFKLISYVWCLYIVYLRIQFFFALLSELHAFCNTLGCTCATGYELVQSHRGVPICRRKTYTEVHDQKESQLHDEDQCWFGTLVNVITSIFILDLIIVQCPVMPNIIVTKTPRVNGSRVICSTSAFATKATLAMVTNVCQSRVRLYVVYVFKSNCNLQFVFTQKNICHPDATCNYDEILGKSVCKCIHGYEGDGFHCEPVPECRSNEQCTANAFCNVENACECLDGYERDLGEL